MEQEGQTPVSPLQAELADKAEFFFGAVKEMQLEGKYSPQSKPCGILLSNGAVEVDDIWTAHTDSTCGD